MNEILESIPQLFSTNRGGNYAIFVYKSNFNSPVNVGITEAAVNATVRQFSAAFQQVVFNETQDNPSNQTYPG